jgi:hypothetical protein
MRTMREQPHFLPGPGLRLTRRQGLLTCCALLAGLSGGAARALTAAKGRVVLTVKGKISRHNNAQAADFDMDMLADLPQHRFVTRTPWDKQAREFTGPLLRDVLSAVGARGRTVLAVALNDYQVEIPTEDAELFEVIVARLIDGQPMRVRDRGPLFIIYPYDRDEQLRSDRYFKRSAWQLRTLDIQ